METRYVSSLDSSTAKLLVWTFKMFKMFRNSLETNDNNPSAHTRRWWRQRGGSILFSETRMIPLTRNWSYYNIPFSFFLILVAGLLNYCTVHTASLILVRLDVHQKLTAAAPFGGHPQRSTRRPTIWRLSKITSNSLETGKRPPTNLSVRSFMGAIPFVSDFLSFLRRAREGGSN
ncbi:hypothetical protein F5B19DRAFT_465051 [Rostrohypoxylon terebratum]|nr:hypothetical protein F5B19DRAFT_465051 [Rostrohypoxylon terebratum]